jgi:thiopeptide-type bacteriocin biosynthesis protein
MLPRSERYPQTYQPHRVADLLPLDAALITHSHPDHFDVASLLRLGPHTPIYVPEVERESLLAIDMAARLEQLGFSKVHRVRPGAEIAIAELKIRALPFFGEQPTIGEILHPDVRNVGCTYLCESRDRRVFVIADSGRDRDGDVRDVSASIRKQFGDVEVLFGGYRAFAMYPILYLFSSVARFLLFVPSSEMTVRQEIMNDGDALLDTAERCGTKYVVPYATGGAPWYWERGLGWRPKGMEGARTDTTPDEVVQLAAMRASSPDGPVASPVRVLLLQAGESVRLGDTDAQIERGPRQVWPYDPPQWQQVNAALTRREGSMLESARTVFRALEPALNTWRSDSRLKHFFFMRKDPGLRLRFLADGTLNNELSALLDSLIDKGAIDVWFRSVYEPESDRFGGAAAMEAVHAWFDTDAAQWMVLDRLRSEGRAAIARDVLCAATALDLVTNAVPDRAEAWAVWRLYASSNGLASGDNTMDEQFGDIQFLNSQATPGEQEVLHAYQAANRGLSSRLSKLTQEGKLNAGIRSVLATIILFHFNRHGLDVAAHNRVAGTMTRALDPALPRVPQEVKG